MLGVNIFKKIRSRDNESDSLSIYFSLLEIFIWVQFLTCSFWTSRADWKIFSNFHTIFSSDNDLDCHVASIAWINLQSQPKVSGHPQKKALPRFPSFNVATMMSTFLSIFFWTCKTTLGRGYGGKGSHCPMLLSEIVALISSSIN